MTFAYGGEVSATLDDEKSLVRPAVDMKRNIAIAFVPDSMSTMLTKTTVGFASPSRVIAHTKEIVNGYVVLSSDYLSQANKQARIELMTHEIGHALGLAHSDDPRNIMFGLLDSRAHRVSIASGDIAGIKAIEKPCVSQPPNDITS